MNVFIEELKWRGMVQDIMPGTEEQLNKEITSAYVGFDPTADSLHIGSLVPILLLVHLQKAGHKPIALVGGATGMVGDPSGKSEERNMLSEDVLNKNVVGIKKQLQQFLDFESNTPNAAVLVNNYDWFKGISFLDFIRDTGKHITVNYMMAKDSVKKRLEGENGMSFTEFTYQLVQGYDYYWLHKNMNCKLQMGGSDQWGNIVTGTEIIRKKNGGEAFAFTCPLIKKADGGKFGKSEQGNIWLDATKTSPFQFYQFWLNASDEDAANWIKIFTFLSKENIDTIIAEHTTDASKRILQKILAKELTIFVHGITELEKAIDTTEKLFAAKTASANSLSEDDLINIEGIEQIKINKNDFENGIDVTTLFTNASIFASKGDARKMIQAGAVSINRNKIDDPKLVPTNDLLLHNKFLLVQKGKKNYYLFEVCVG
ncbi:MAG: tyrosine--tRNA ligase [Ferruginibacter sp.]|nr:tyrosine--tRNA ligase [Ferruginibacter sp.]